MSPKAEGGLWNSRGRSPREFHKPPEGEGHLITNFQNIMVLVCNTIVMGDTIEKVSKSSILTKVSILSILAKSIGNSIPLEPAMFLVSIAEQSLNTS